MAVAGMMQCRNFFRSSRKLDFVAAVSDRALYVERASF